MFDGYHRDWCFVLDEGLDPPTEKEPPLRWLLDLGKYLAGLSLLLVCSFVFRSAFCHGRPSRQWLGSCLISAEIKTINWCNRVKLFGNNCFSAQKMLHFMGEQLGAAKQESPCY